MTAAGKTAERATDAARPAGLTRGRKLIGYWLFAMCGMVFVMVIIGGVTRLTGSGLSIVDWRPVTGWLPPMSDAAWLALFEAYKQTPEFLKINTQMDVEGFKGIFWLEYIHRLWGRLLGIAFAVPFLYFLVKRWVDRRLARRLALFFVLGGAQGVLGWFMVKSGLVDDPDVSPYRLTAHLGLAIAIYAAMFWTALDLAVERSARRALPTHLRRLSAVILGWVFATMLSGGFVAGLDAGKTYNTFPLMDGKWIPDGLFLQDPAWRNFFENVTTVQFDHRVLAIGALLLIAVTWALALRARLSPPEMTRFHLLVGVGLLQVVLGVSTLLLAVPISLAAIHQAFALVLLTAAMLVVWYGGPGKSAGDRRSATT